MSKADQVQPETAGLPFHPRLKSAMTGNLVRVLESFRLRCIDRWTVVSAVWSRAFQAAHAPDLWWRAAPQAICNPAPLPVRKQDHPR